MAVSPTFNGYGEEKKPRSSPLQRGNSQRVFGQDFLERTLSMSLDKFSLDGPALSTSNSNANLLSNIGSTSKDISKGRLPLFQTSRKTKNVFTAGRPPWYNKHGQVREAFLIGCAGGSASGKTTVAKRIIEQLELPWVVLLSMDSFYKTLTPEQIELAHKNQYNFDSPDSFDYPLLRKTIKMIKEGKQVEVPIYDFTTHSRSSETQVIYGADIVVFEGIFALYDDEVNEMMDMRIFVDTDDDVRLARRLRRDIAERGRDIVGVIQQYSTFVKPAFDQYIRPTLNKAHVIIPRGGDNHVAIDLISKHIRRMLEARGVNFRTELAAVDKDQPLPSSVNVLASTNQIKALHTIIRNRNACRDDLIFYSQRLFRLLVEAGLSKFPFQNCDVETPAGYTYHGMSTIGEVIGVSIVRAGVALENALQDVCKDVKIGKILIQTDIRTGEPQLHYCHLPRSISQGHALLMDATIASGAAALMAIRVLKDHHVPEENIVFLALIAAPQGLHAVAYAFPKVRIVVSEIDEGLNEQFHIVPGIGNFGDRFYGTE